MEELNPETSRTQKFFVNTLEQIIDKSECYVYLHNKSFEHYYLVNNMILTLPSILILVFCGLAILTFSKIGKESQIGYLSFIAGLIIFSAFLEIIRSIYKYAELTEFHRLSLAEWRKLSRDISGIIIKIKASDSECDIIEFYFDFFSHAYNRMEEISPKIPEYLIVLFNSHMDIYHRSTVRPKICIAFIPDQLGNMELRNVHLRNEPLRNEDINV